MLKSVFIHIMRKWWLCFLVSALLISCHSTEPPFYLFEVKDKTETGLDFTNKLIPTPSFNMFKYMYFYNGAGVGAGDFNKDGLIDLFFASNQAQNKLYLNRGNLKFLDVTAAAKIPLDSGWSTGVSIVDINNDGWLDIYICRLGNFENLKSSNQLLICIGNDKNGTPQYENKAKEYGLDFSGFSTQAAFFDYDVDGDLDMYLMNHSLRFNGTFANRETYFNTYDTLSGDRFYRNDKGKYIDVTKQTGINSSIIGYGLGIAVSDINLDGFPDLYIGNDFHENDYLYINQKNGTFKDELPVSMKHTSQFSMGVDVADINNDIYPEIISVDMLPEDPYLLKRSLGEDEYNLFNYKIKAGYFPQYARNNLQLNNGNGTFSEIGRYAGIYATDWSWGPLWMDFDNDGWKDLFISNGIPKRLNDMDYVSFVSNNELQDKIRQDKIEDRDLTLINKFPEIKLKNKFFLNKKQALFEDAEHFIKNDRPTYSSGSVYADFDNDGDLDIAVNNIDEPVLLYENRTNTSKESKAFLRLSLQGAPDNKNAIGARVLVFAGNELRSYEKYPVKGFQSSMEVPLHIGLHNIVIDSVIVIWPDNTFEKIRQSDVYSGNLSLQYKSNLPVFDYNSIKDRTNKPDIVFEDITAFTALQFLHRENPFNEFDREPLIPHTTSREGPAVAVGDMNKDNLEDIFIGASKWEKAAVFIQTKSGQFEKSIQLQLDNDSTFEDADACWADVNNDGYTDLIVSSGGNEYYGESEFLLPRVYLNNAKQQLTKLATAFDNIFVTQSCVLPYDFNKDGYIDLFLGGRTMPWEYGRIPRSYLLQNNGAGKFMDVTQQYCPELMHAGMVTNGAWADMDKDGDTDLVLALEWGGIVAYIKSDGKFSRKMLTNKKGWWNVAVPCDIDADGDMDILAGNNGLNNRLHPSADHPVKLYYNDFDGNGKKEQILTYFLKNREVPFANKDELQKQIPAIKKQFLYAEDFAKASLEELFSADKLRNAEVLTADYFQSIVLLNDGKMNFAEKPLPWQAQLGVCRDAVLLNANNDTLPDIFLTGGFYDNNTQMGAYDANAGLALVNKGNGVFEKASSNFPFRYKQIRHVRKIKIKGEEVLLLANNNDSIALLKLRKK